MSITMDSHSENELCNACNAPLYDDTPLLLFKTCTHKFHRRCLMPRHTESNVICPTCSDVNQSASSSDNQSMSENNNVSYTRPTSNHSAAGQTPIQI